MQVKDIISLIPEAKILGNYEKNITGIQFDSRKLQKGDLFAAISGFKVDGHNYLPEALKRGTGIVVLEKDYDVPPNITKVIVPNSREALAKISSFYYNYPSSKLKLIGITGTNGKTSTSYLIHEFLKSNKIKTGLIGTVEKGYGNKNYDDPNTTPESLVLQKILHDMVEEKLDAAVMEVSSHSLELSRVEGTTFDLAVFTNLTHDHLDFHKDMESYFKSKAKLFTKIKDSGWAIINIDDPYGFRLARNLTPNINSFTYGLSDLAQIKAKNYMVEKGISFDLITPFGTRRLVTPYLMGLYNLYNLLGAISASIALGLKLDEIEKALSKFKTIPGRFQQVHMGQEYKIIIDYAHTPDGVKKVLQLARTMQKGKGKIITVLGAAGERDPLKRPIMGRIAAELSDLFVITEQDSRTEDVGNIINDIYQGAKNFKNIKIIEDRIEAINYALSKAEREDLVLILGKGHEKTLYLDRETNYKGDFNAVKNYFLNSSSPFITS